MDGGSGVGRASGATGLNKIIKRLKEFPRSPTCPGYPFPSLSMPSTLAAILRRILKRERERERGGGERQTEREIWTTKRILRKLAKEGGKREGGRIQRARCGWRRQRDGD